MKVASNTGMLLLGIFLLLYGLFPLLHIDLPNRDTFLQIFAVAAGVMILMNK
jgi:hypothetical protein